MTKLQARAKSHEIELYTINRFTVAPVSDQTKYKTLIIGFSQLEIEAIPEAVNILRQVLIN
jgi:GntR family transcriptional regulator/MocR family aminotransferase